MAKKHHYNLGFISDEDIFKHVKETVELYRTTINLAEFNTNIVDPIKLTFDAKVYGKSISGIIEDECLRQIDKSNSNHIGYFPPKPFPLRWQWLGSPRQWRDGLRRAEPREAHLC